MFTPINMYMCVAQHMLHLAITVEIDMVVVDHDGHRRSEGAVPPNYGGVIRTLHYTHRRRLSAAPSNGSGPCSKSCRATERYLHSFILNLHVFVSNRS